MGYFSNGTEGNAYRDEYCRECVHGQGCAVWAAHMEHNYNECNNEASILHILIPRSKDKVGNEKCTMFKPKSMDRRK